MNKGTVSVVIDDSIRWVRHSGSMPGGVSVAERGSLLSVLSLLSEATEQVIVQLRALENADPVSDVY